MIIALVGTHQKIEEIANAIHTLHNLHLAASST